MILSIIQARMSSQRLPGKVLMPLCGTPMLLVMVDRVKEARKIDQLVIATSMDKTDEPIRELCRKNRILCFSGSLNDVLDRFYWLAQLFNPEHVVRLTGDCPMIDPEVIDKTIEYHIKGGFQYTRNYGYRDGEDVEVMTFDALCRAWKDSSTPYDREHVTPWISSHPTIFRIGYCRKNEGNGEMFCGAKISIDTEEDYLKVNKLLEILVNLDSTFSILRHF